MNVSGLITFLSGLMLLFFGCGMFPNLAGDTSETGNTFIAGSVSLPSGQPAANTQVILLSRTYNPVVDGQVPESCIDTTNALGEYRFTNQGKGNYSIQGVQIDQRTRFLINTITAQSDTTIVPRAMVQISGVIKVLLNDSTDKTNGYLYIPGTTISVFLGDNVGFALLDSVPAGLIEGVYYNAKNKTTPSSRIADSITIPSGGLVTLAYYGWKHSGKLYFNTTVSGANVAGNVVDLPVLVRLNAGNFNFTQAFNGSSTFIEIPNTASSKLTFPQHGNYTVSAWVYLDSLPSGTTAANPFGDIIAKGNLEYHLQVTMDAWQFSEMESGIGWDDTQVPAQVGAWFHVVGVRKGAKQYLYVNGTTVDSSITVASDSSNQAFPQNISLGGLPSKSWYFLDGKIDEARILNISQSANWIKLCYMNQKSTDALIMFRN
jgi:hypothetical protein